MRAFRFIPVVTLLLILSLAPCRAATADWTLMFYMDCTNNLEAAQLDNLRDMLKVGSSDRVNVVVLCTRSPLGDEDDGYSNEGVANLPDWSGGKLLYVKKGALEELDDWGEVSMADGATLERLLAEVPAKYPARRYAVIFGDHGQAWPGCCGDEREGHEDDVLQVGVIGKAVETFEAQHGPLEVVGFDACLMGNFETARALAGGARFMIGSEELEPGVGWAYTPTLQALVRNPAMDGAALGTVVCDAYLQQFKGEDEEMGVTLSVVDLGKLGPLVQAVDAFGGVLSGRLQGDRRASWIKLAAIRRRSEEYGKSTQKGEDGSQVFDLGHFSKLVMKDMPGSKEAQAASAVDQALRGCVVHAVHGSARPNARGLSIFVPSQKKVLENDAPVAYATVPHVAGSGWLSFLAAFTGSTALATERPQLGDLTVSGNVIGGGVASVTLTSNTKADDISDAWFTLARKEGDRTIIIGQVATDIGDNGKLSEAWDGGWFTMGSGQTHLIAPIAELDEVEDDEDAYVAQVPAEFHRARGKTWRPVTLHFYVKFKKNGVSGRFLYAFTQTKAGQTQVRLGAGDVVRPVYLSVDADGEEEEVTSDDAEDHITIGAGGLKVGYDAVPAGHYAVGFVITDYADKSTEQMVDIEVKE